MKTMEVRRLPDAAPVIDGRLDEAVWENATVVDDFHQIEPLEYQAPSDPTRILVFYDDDALYVGARMPQSLEVVGTVLRQGREFWSDDFFALIIDTFNDKRKRLSLPGESKWRAHGSHLREHDGYQLGTGAGSGAPPPRRKTVAGRRKWPFPSSRFSFNPDNDTWGINFTRDIGRTNELSGWVSRNNDANPSIAGEAVGFTNLQLGRGLDVVPSVVLEGHKTVNPENLGLRCGTVVGRLLQGHAVTECIADPEHRFLGHRGGRPPGGVHPFQTSSFRKKGISFCATPTSFSSGRSDS